ncbi:MAG: hypothetical protein J6C27_06625 [Clostridia bacterium]|nr:hypothetical protein [Clostridia bacterium]
MNNEKKNSRTANFLKNSSATFLYQAILLISGFITPRVMLTFYGSEINGLVSSVAQFVGYLNLVEAGLSAATIYALYKPLADNDITAISAVVSAAKKFYYKSGYLFLGLIAVLAMAYPFFIDMPKGMGHIDVLIIVFISGFAGVVDLFTLAKYRALLTADQKTYILAVSSTVYVVLNTAIIAVMSMFRLDIALVKGIALLAVVVRTVILVIYCKKKYPKINYSEKPNYDALSKRWDALFQQLLGVVQNGSPVVILTVVTRDLKLISIYTVYNMVIAGLNSLLSIFISGLSASFGEVIAKGEQKTLQKAYSDFETAYYVLICIIYSIAFIMILPFVKIYTAGVTDTNYLNAWFGFLFVLNGLLYNIKTPQGMLVLSAGLYKETRYRSLAQAVLIIIVGVPLTFKFGVIGILLGLLASNLYRAIDLLFFIPKYVTKMSFIHTLKKWFVMAFNIAAIFLISSKLPISPDGYITWALWAVIVAVVCVVINLITFTISCKGNMGSLFNRILSIIKR